MVKPFLTGKVAIVTGASSGIGRATALALARAGAQVVLAARSVPALRETARGVEASGREALIVPTDVAEQGQVGRLVEETLSRWGRVDILVSNAGVYARCPIVAISAEALARSMAVNFYGGVHAILAVLPHMLQQRSGHIMLVTSLDGKKGLPPDAPYVAAKFALTGFGEVLRQELRGTGVHVTTVLPGRVDTPMIANLSVPWMSAKIPPEAVARAVVRALRHPRPEVITPPHIRILLYLNALSPRLGDWAVRVFGLSGSEETDDAR